MIEFALISTLLMFILFGGADFARVITLKTAVQNAADAGASAAYAAAFTKASCPPTVDISGIQTAATNDFNNRASNFTVTATVVCGSTTSASSTPTAATCTASQCTTGYATYVQISTSVPFNMVTVQPFITQSLTVTGSALARVYAN